MEYSRSFDVLIIGGGHAGTEAALAAARSGAQTLLITDNIETIGQMSCNPAIGGIGKGHLVKEIDALGGAMAIASDQAGIQFRTLNASKGAAVRATRAQADRALYKAAIRSLVDKQTNLNIIQQSVIDILIENNHVCGIVSQVGIHFRAPNVVLTVGTFLKGMIHIGQTHFSGGRAGDPASNRLADRFRDLNFTIDRLKTGTPARIDKRSIDYGQLQEQLGDSPRPVFSYMGSAADHPKQVSCHITHTNVKTHDIIRSGLDKSPMYTGNIEGLGPRYCPSIEDKIVRFADRTSHQIFIEPEGLNSNEVYPNGISTSLPFDIQLDFIHSIHGFESAHITRPGYAIEYDFFNPTGLHASLETKKISGLFFAGQINGTTGYEEAAAQGLIAGLNAARRSQDKQYWCPRRDEAYIGVMIDDLVTRGTLEPYRMFTSRAEYRLILREDNADLRLTEIGREMGLIDNDRWQSFCTKQNAIKNEQKRLAQIWVTPNNTLGKEFHKVSGISVSRETRALDLLKRPEINYQLLTSAPSLGPAVADNLVAEQIEIQARYAGYLTRQHEEVARFKRQDSKPIPIDFNFEQISGLSAELKEKLASIRPSNIGQASRIQGITPAALSLLMVFLKRHRTQQGSVEPRQVASD